MPHPKRQSPKGICGLPKWYSGRIYLLIQRTSVRSLGQKIPCGESRQSDSGFLPGKTQGQEEPEAATVPPVAKKSDMSEHSQAHKVFVGFYFLYATLSFPKFIENKIQDTGPT